MASEDPCAVFLCLPLSFIQSIKSEIMKQLEDIYNRVVEATLEASGLTFEQLATSRTERSVIARVVMINTLIEIGFTEFDIAAVSGMSQQRVNSLKNSARYRLKGLAARVMREEVKILLQKILP